MANFQYLKMAAVRHLDLLCMCLDHPQRAFGDLIIVQKFVTIGFVILKICSFDVMRVWLENAYSCPVWGVFGANGGSRNFLQFIPLGMQ